MIGDRNRNPTSREASSQPNQWEIKPKDVKLPPQTKVKDFIRERFCRRPPGEHRPDRADKVRVSFNTGLQEIRENLDSIPEELKDLFTRKTNSLMREFETYYERTLRHYGSQSGTEWKFFRNLSEHSMKLTEASLQEMKEDLDLLRSFQKAREEHEDALNSVRQDNQSLVREWADTQIKSAMKKYSLALQSRDQQGRDRSEAKKQIEKASRWLKERSRWLKERPEAFNKLGEMQQQIKGIREHIEGKIKATPEELKDLFKKNVESSITGFQNSYDQTIHSYKSQSGASWRESWNWGEQSMERHLSELQEMEKDLEKWKKVNEIQAPVKNVPASTSNDTLPHIEQSVADEVINDFKQAHLQVLKSYQQSSDTQSLQDARKHFEEAHDRVRTLSEYLNHWDKIHEFKVQLEAAHSEDTPYNKAIKDLFDKTIDTVINAYQDALACLQDGWPLRGENMGDAVRKGADQRFRKACDQLKTLNEASYAYQETRKEHEKALNYYVPQDYQFLARKLAKKREELVIADLVQGDQQGSNWLHAKEHIEETSRWLKERFQPYKKPIENLIEKITSAFSPLYDLEERCHPLDKKARKQLQEELRPAERMQIRILGTLEGLHKSQLKQFDKDRNGEIKPPTRTPDQWRQKLEETYTEIDKVSTCLKNSIEKKYNLYNPNHLIGLASQLLNESTEFPVTDKLTDKWKKFCVSHDALAICMGDEFKNIDQDIHQEMEAYKKNIKIYKEQKEKLDKNLGEFKSLLAKARQLEPNAETREFIASIENRSKSTLAKTEKLIANMEAEHEKFKEYLRDRGWLDRRFSHRNTNFSSSLPQTDIASTSGRQTRNKSTKASASHKKPETINE
jgi:hypothetical protein